MAQPELKRARLTKTLRRRLFKAPNFETFVKENSELLTSPRLCDYLAELCRESGQTAGHIILCANIDRTYGHQIFNGTRNPSRDKLLQLAFGFKLGVDDTQELLKIAQKSPLYPHIIRDAAILRCLHDHKSIDDIQELLSRMGLTLLGEVDKHG